MLDLAPWIIAAVVLIAIIFVVRGMITRAERAAAALEALRTRARRYRALADAAPASLVGVDWSRFFWREAARAYGEMRTYEALNQQDAAAAAEVERALAALGDATTDVEPSAPPEAEAVEIRRGLNAALATVARLVEAGDVTAERGKTISQALTSGIVRSRLGSWLHMATEARAAGDFDREAEHWRRAATDAEQLSGEEGARLKVRFTQDAERAEAHAAQRRAAEAEAAAHARAEAKAAAAAQEAAHAPEAEPQRRPSLNAELTLRPDPGPDVRAPFPVSSRRR
jgi:hypothetical protein